MSTSIQAKRRALLELQLRRRRAEKAERDQVVAVPRDGWLPCSHQQEGLWFLHQLDPVSSVYHIPLAVRLRGRLDVAALRAALTALVARHESLRTRFDSRHGVPHQVIDPAPEAWLTPIVELSSDDVTTWIAAQTQLPFDLQAGPLFRSSLARIHPDEHVLLLVMHHIVADGWSVTVLTREMSGLYTAIRANTTAAPAALAVQAADHAAWQRRWLTGAVLEGQVGYWRDTLHGVATLEFPTDRSRPAQPTGAGALFEQRLPNELAAALRELARREEVSFLAVLLAGFLSVLGRYTGQQDLAVGSVFSGRTRTEIEPLVGFFANTLVLRTSLTGDPTFRELVRRCNSTVLGANAHQDVPFGLVVEALKPDRVPGRNPLFQVSFTLQAAGVTGDGLALDGLVVTELDTRAEHARFDLAVAAVERSSGGLDLTMEYSTELFDPDRIERLAEHLAVAMAGIVADPDMRISDVEIMPDAERGRVLDDWNPAPVPRGGGLLHELVARRAAEAPDRVAMRFAGRDLRYGELDRQANRLANLLAGAGVRPGCVVGVLLERGFGLPVAELGVLKAGGAWLPLDPQYPAERLAYQLADADVSLVVTTSDLAGHLPDRVSPVLLDSGVLDGQPDTAPAAGAGPEDVAYVIYTSGSTGKPKGVMVPHRAVVNFCANLAELFSMSPSDRVLQFANPAFDVSVSDFFATFAAGATAVGAPRAILLDPGTLQELMREERITFGDIPPAMLRLLDPAPLADLRALFIGMEPFSPALVNRWSRPGREFHNGYGPTEVTITCVDYRCPDEALTAPPPIGRAMANHRAYVLDGRRLPVPIGVPGELYMAGAGLAHGYLGRADLTAEKFVPDPYGKDPGTRMYATGDLARWRADGNLEFLGRVDRQVKIRGLRIELGEIEHAVNTFPGVRQCAVTVREPGRPEAYLAAYVVPAPGPDVDADKLRDYLADRLPLHMIPVVLSLAELPLTAAGKLDEARLPVPEPQTAGYAPPTTGTERRLAGMWRELLKADAGQIGVHDNFFVLGGNSLQAIQLITRIRDAFDVSLNPRDLFTYPALGRLAAQIDQLFEPEPDASDDGQIAALEAQLRQKRAEKANRGRDRIAPVPRGPNLPCSYQQEGLWLLNQLDPASSVYHLPLAMRIHGELDIEALQRGLTVLVRRHESLRTRFDDADGLPFQVIDPAPCAWPLQVTRLPGEDSVAEWVSREARRPFDLHAGPLLRSSIARVAPDEHVLLLVLHHIIADGWSIAVLTSELSHVYEAALSGTAAALPELALQPVDHAAWQRRWSAGGVLDLQLGYWRAALDGIADVEFPADRPRPAQPTGAGALLTRRLPDELAMAVRKLARGDQASSLAVLLAGFLVVLHRYTGQQDLAVGSVFSGRTRSELELLVGYFANVLVLRTSVSGDPTFRELVRRCHDTVLDATAHQDVPFGLVVDALKPVRVPGRNPLFQIGFSLATGETAGAEFRLGGTRIEEVDTVGEWARFDLAMAVTDRPDGTLDVTVEHSTELFDSARMERLISHFAAVLAAGATVPDTRIDALDPLSEAEFATLVTEWNPAPVRRPGGLLQELVTRRAAAGPDRVAVRFAGACLTYHEVDVRSNRLAHMLAEDFKVAAGRVVGVLLERGLDLTIAQLGVLKAGGAWLPLDPQHPEKRISYQTQDADVPLVITTSGLTGLLPVGLSTLCLDDPATRASLARRPGTPPAADIRPDDVAYVMYTSGSTGTPKGVMVPHRAAVQYAQSTAELFSITDRDRLSQVANPCFDVSIFDVYAAFAAGATVVGAPRATLLDPDALGAFLRDERVTVSYVPPALLSLVDPEVPRDLRIVMVAGETCPAGLANRWSRPGTEFHNGYGPTEVTVTCTDYRCPAGTRSGPPPIGRPMANHRGYVLDKRLRLTPIGVPGQLHMAGAGLARGYLGRPDLTADKFVPDPYSPEPGGRMYATGDLVRWRDDGELEFLGRADRQVKIRGLRMELGEIEHALANDAGVRQAVVVVKDPGTPRARLVGYLVPEPGHDVDPDTVRERLADRLPLYMVPGAIVILADLPLTGIGKVDQARLPDPEGQPDAGYIAPSTQTQRRLAGTWRGLLGGGADQIGIHDDFFNLGGNSLQATQLIARIWEGFGVTVHPRELFASPTLERLATRIDEESRPPGGITGAAQSMSVLVPIKPGGARPPLFFVHAVGGSVTPYAPLAALLGADQPFYGLEHPGLHGDTAARRIPEIAASYLTAIREVQPVGPFHLGGWSFGGVVAVEMAGQLRAGGEEVALVVVLDAGLPTEAHEPDQAELLSWFVSDIAGLASSDPPEMDLTVLRQLPASQQVDLALDALESAGLASAAVRAELSTRIRVFLANSRAYLAYRPTKYGGRLVLLNAADEPDDDVERWHALAPEDFEHHPVPGNHYTLLRAPHLSVVAQAVRHCLDDPPATR
jgi:amino acid adenylation domain-containing protein